MNSLDLNWAWFKFLDGIELICLGNVGLYCNARAFFSVINYYCK